MADDSQVAVEFARVVTSEAQFTSSDSSATLRSEVSSALKVDTKVRVGDEGVGDHVLEDSGGSRTCDRREAHS